MFAFRKSVIAVMKLRIFDTSLSVIDIKLEGYEKPMRAHIAKTKNIRYHADFFASWTRIATDPTPVIIRCSIPQPNRD